MFSIEFITTIFLILYWITIIYLVIKIINHIKKRNSKSNYHLILFYFLIFAIIINGINSLIIREYSGVWYPAIFNISNIISLDHGVLPNFLLYIEILTLLITVIILSLIIKNFIKNDKQDLKDYLKTINEQKNILEHIPVSIEITDTKGNIEYANKRFYSLTGYSESEIIGKKPSILGSGINKITDFKSMWETISSGNEWSGVFHNKKKNGEFFWERVKIVPYFNDKGEIINYIAIKEDITETVNIDDDKEMLLTTIEQISDTVEILDLDGRIQYVNKTFEKVSGYTKEECIGKFPIDLFSDGSEESLNMNKRFEKAMKEGKTCQGRFINKTKDGRYITEDTIVTPIFNKIGKLTNYSSVKRDITASIKSEIEQKVIRDQLNQAQRLESVGQLVGGIAHDFNNSLGGIMAAAQLLNNPKHNLSEKALSYVDLILKSSRRANGLTKKLLTFSKRKNSHFSTIHIFDVIVETVEILQQTINKGIKINILNEAQQDIILGDISGIQSVLINFGINSSHAIKGIGSITYKIFNTTLDEKYCNNSSYKIIPGYFCVIEVNDTGCGIAQENMEKIFEPFFTTKDDEIGSGLGLTSTLRTIVEHKGAIEVESILNEGTTFRIFLPCSLKDKFENEQNKNQRPIEGVGKILLIDDEETNRILGKDILNGLGYEVILASNGPEAINIYKEYINDIDLVLLDMIMPEMSGQDVFIKIKEININCKIIILSGYINDIDLTELRDKGLNAIIKKPYIITELSQTINRVLTTPKML